MRDFSIRERPGVPEVTTHCRSAMQQEPKANRHKNRSHTHIPLSLDTRTHSLASRFLSFAFSRM